MDGKDVNIRDPFVLPYQGTYYLYGTRSATCWGPADGFDCYTSQDLVSWDGPFEIFHRPEGFFADQAYWAPECISCGDAFYLITTLGGEGIKKGIYSTCMESPMSVIHPARCNTIMREIPFFVMGELTLTHKVFH